MTEQNRIPVVDIFAGPGGLGEGFARFPSNQVVAVGEVVKIKVMEIDVGRKRISVTRKF